MSEQPSRDPVPETSLSAEPAEAAPTEAQAAEGSSNIKLRLFGRTDVGQVREHNEDNFIVADLSKGQRGMMEPERDVPLGSRGMVLGVCDGMGGAAAGEVASQLAVDIIFQKMIAGDRPSGHDDLASRLVQAIEAAGLRIFSEAKLDRTRRGMGTTSTVASLLDDHLFIGQVGDSRAYILRGDKLVQVTRDQSLVNQLIEAGQLTEEEAETFEHNNIILQALGTSDSVQVDLTFVELKRGDTLMLCSDGLSGMVRNEEIREVLRAVDDPQEACKVLIDRANQAGGHDNVTVVISKFLGEGLDAPTPDDISGLKYRKYQLPDRSPPPPMSAPDPSRRVKELDQAKISMPLSAGGAGYDSRGTDSDKRRGDSRGRDSSDLDRGAYGLDDPVDIPTDSAPQWLIVMMIASAFACIAVAAYYLLRP
jgi:PPM family protein phosphatase